MKRFLLDNTDQIKKIRYRLASYLPISYKAIRNGVSIRGLVQSRFPFLLGAPRLPSSISIQITDACNLKCLYCNNPLFSNPRTFMKEDTFQDVLLRLDELKRVDRIRVCGGEPTLHPKFDTISGELSKRTRFLSIVTNAQWHKEKIPHALVDHYDLIEVSIDAGGKETYESSRIGGRYEHLMDNLQKLNELRQSTGSKAHINIRFMIRPSNDADKEKEYDFLKTLCNTIMPQYLLKHPESDYEEDVYIGKNSADDSYPKCTLPFKDLQIRADGDIPLCQVTGSTIDPGRKRIIGNVRDNSLAEVWNGPEMMNIRNAHKHRVYADMNVCKGCRGV